MIEEQGGALNEPLEADTDATKNGSANTTLKNLNLGNCIQLEKRVKKELEENGFLDADEMNTSADAPGSDDDEILAELHQCQQELKQISALNQATLRMLLNRAKANVAKQELRKKLNAADAEVNEIYRRFMQAKQKKRALSKKEKEQATRALKERDQLAKQLDTFKLPT